MILALTAKKKIGFINGKIVEPDPESPLYEDWLRLKMQHNGDFMDDQLHAR